MPQKILITQGYENKRIPHQIYKILQFLCETKKIWQLFSGTNFEKCVYIDAFGAKITWPETK